MKILDMWNHLIKRVEQQSTKNVYKRSGQANFLLRINTLHIITLSVLTPTFGIICWTIQEIENLDIMTTKILNVTGNFTEIQISIDCIYRERWVEGG